MRQLTEDSILYLGQWTQDSMYSDYDLFYELGEYELCAVRLADSGAIEENNNTEECNINSVACDLNRDAESKLVDSCLKGVEVTICAQCNHHCFTTEEMLSFSDTDSMLNEQCPQCLRGKMISEDQYYKKGK